MGRTKIMKHYERVTKTFPLEFHYISKNYKDKRYQVSVTVNRDTTNDNVHELLGKLEDLKQDIYRHYKDRHPCETEYQFPIISCTSETEFPCIYTLCQEIRNSTGLENLYSVKVTDTEGNIVEIITEYVGYNY